MSVDTFLVIPVTAGGTPISGPLQTDAYFAKAFGTAAITQPLDFTLGAETAVAVGGATSGASVGKAQFGALAVTKQVDTMSPHLFQAMVSGRHFAVAQLYQRRADAAGGKPHLGYEFQTVFVTGIQWTGGGGEPPLEQVTFAYGAVVVGTRQQNPDGSLAAAVKRGWSQVTNSSAPPDSLLLA